MQTKAQANVVVVGDHDFESVVLKADKPVIVDFWAEWCPPCIHLAPFYAQLSQEYAGRVVFAKLDVEEHGNTQMDLNIRAMPTLVMFYQGKEIGRMVGPSPRQLKARFEQILAEHNLL